MYMYTNAGITRHQPDVWRSLGEFTPMHHVEKLLLHHFCWAKQFMHGHAVASLDDHCHGFSAGGCMIHHQHGKCYFSQTACEPIKDNWINQRDSKIFCSFPSANQPPGIHQAPSTAYATKSLCRNFHLYYYC